MKGVFRFVYLFLVFLLVIGVSACGTAPPSHTTTSIVQPSTTSVSPDITASSPTATSPAATVSRVVLAEMFTGDW
jgi:hypothetical protein